jgi:alpha-galactosidase
MVVPHRPGTDIARPQFVENLEKRLAEMTRLANDPKASLVESLGATKTREQQVPIIDALVNDHEGYFQVNVPNNGALTGIPDDVVVELPALINKKGIQTLHVGALSSKVMLEHVMPEWLSMERGLHAFKTGDRSMLLWSILHVQQTQSYDQAVAALEDLLAMEGHEEMNDYFKYLAGEDLLTAKHSVS